MRKIPIAGIYRELKKVLARVIDYVHRSISTDYTCVTRGAGFKIHLPLRLTTASFVSILDMNIETSDAGAIKLMLSRGISSASRWFYREIMSPNLLLHGHL